MITSNVLLLFTHCCYKSLFTHCYIQGMRNAGTREWCLGLIHHGPGMSLSHALYYTLHCSTSVPIFNCGTRIDHCLFLQNHALSLSMLNRSCVLNASLKCQILSDLFILRIPESQV